MATSVQFLRGQPIRPVIVIAGRSSNLVRYCLDVLLARLPGDLMITRFDAAEAPPKHILTKLGAPSLFHNNLVIIYSNAHLTDTSPFEWYADQPSAKTYLVLTSERIRRDDGERIIPSTSKVLYIDCGNLTEDNLIQIAVLSGLNEKDATWLVNRCAGDVNEMIRVLDLMEVFESMEPGLVQKICGHGDTEAGWQAFIKYAIIDISTLSTIRQLKRRFTQLLHMSVGITGYAMVTEIARRADIEPFLAKKLLPVAKGTSPALWLERLVAIIPLENYARLGCDGVREYLELVIK